MLGVQKHVLFYHSTCSTMMVHLPPGLRYLALLLLPWLATSCVTYTFLDVFSRLGAPISHRAAIVSAFLSRPVFLIASYVWNVQKSSFETRRTGSIAVPQVYDPWPLGLSLTTALVKSFKSGYPGWCLRLSPCSITSFLVFGTSQGDILLPWCRQYGNTYILKLIGESRVRHHGPSIDHKLTRFFPDLHFRTRPCQGDLLIQS